MQISRDMTSRPGVGTLMYMGEDSPVQSVKAELAARKKMIVYGGAAIWALGGGKLIPRPVAKVAGIGALAAFLLL